ncbi:AAA family ATPase [Trichloromonas sp.]|uniref:ATP-binding protein n=1 Tax=Trichloromonas sp. TaxID=3069249 RepID=UPI002A404701|nr:ATP-binding protein [Trichloromonas sp.]
MSETDSQAPPNPAASLSPQPPALDEKVLEQCRADGANFRAAQAEAVSRLLDSLAKGRRQLAESFAQQPKNPPPEEAKEFVKRLQTELSAQRTWLLKKVRPQFEQAAKGRLAGKKTILALLEKLTDSARRQLERYQAERDALPLPADAGLSARLAFRLRETARTRGLLTGPAENLPSDKELEYHPLVEELSELSAKLHNRVADLWPSIRFHFQVADEELARLIVSDQEKETDIDFGKGVEEAEQLACGVLAAAEQQIAELFAPLDDYWAGLDKRLEVCGQELARGEYSGSRPWRDLGEGLKRRGEKAFRHYLNISDHDETSLLRAASKKMFGSLQEVLHKEAAPQEKLLSLTDLPSAREVQRRSETFPPLHRRLFTLGPLKTREFLVARDEELEVLDDLFTRWEQGQACSLAVIGPEGSGKTSLVNCFASEYGSQGELLRLEIDKRLQSPEDVIELFRQGFDIKKPLATLDELIGELLTRPKGMILIEGGHNLALRVVGGGRAVEAICYLLLATRRHFLWLVTFRKVPWERLDYQYRVNRFFTHQVSTLLAGQQEIRQVLLLRQRISGYPLTFTGEGNGKENNGTAGDGRERENHFFRELFAASGGNLDAAFHYWLLCLGYDAETESFHACPLGKIDFSFLRELDGDQRFTLAEVLGHGGLSAEEHQRIFHCDPLTSRLRLEYLASLGLLLTEPPKGREGEIRYRLNPVYYTPVVKTLETMNILY